MEKCSVESKPSPVSLHPLKLKCKATQSCASPLRALHRVAGVGKRALGYCLASRMAALDSLDLKDSDGMVQYTRT